MRTRIHILLLWCLTEKASSFVLSYPASRHVLSSLPWTFGHVTIGGCRDDTTRQFTRLHAEAGVTDLSELITKRLEESGVEEPACYDAVSRMGRVEVPVLSSSEDTTVGISYVRWEPSPEDAKRNECEDLLPLLLIHGFDSSCLEFRRLGPRLASRGLTVYAVDLLGWGFSGATIEDGGDVDCSASAKMEALRAFWKTVEGGGGPVCVGGASLGGAAAIELASSDNDFVKAVVLIDAQGFTDGIGPPSLLPPPLARLGVQVLRSTWLRESANRMSYFDTETYATDDAVRIGRLHCLVRPERWEDAQLSFIRSGGFYPSRKVPKVGQRTLVLWGRNDEILDGKVFGDKFMEELPNAEFQWIEECGHVPHLEQADKTAGLICDFLRSCSDGQ